MAIHCREGRTHYTDKQTLEAFKVLRGCVSECNHDSFPLLSYITFRSLYFHPVIDELSSTKLITFYS